MPSNSTETDPLRMTLILIAIISISGLIVVGWETVVQERTKRAAIEVCAGLEPPDRIACVHAAK